MYPESGFADPNESGKKTARPVFVFNANGSGEAPKGPWEYYRTGRFIWWVDPPVVLEEYDERQPETLVLCFRSSRPQPVVWFECLYAKLFGPSYPRGYPPECDVMDVEKLDESHLQVWVPGDRLWLTRVR
jgi:hypothetical protein